MSSVSPDVLQRMDEAHQLHPFTNHDDMHREGTHIIQSADGCWLTGEKGEKLFDGLAGLWCVHVGYNRPEIIDAITKQLRTVAYYPSFFNSTTEPAILLADRLAKLAPGPLKHVFFSNSGSEANETALKLIRGYHKLKGQSARHKILTRTYGYHGVTLATTSMTGLPGCFQPFDLPLPGFIHVPGPHAYASGTDLDADAYGEWCIAETERIIVREDPATIAALFAEPVQGAGGVIVPPSGYLKKLRELCRSHGILFVADEVITGFGRLGAWFASELWDLDPDFMCLAKGITSGYLPLGATMVTDEISEVLIHGGYLAHGFTYSGHPTAAAAALANIDVLEKENLIAKTRDEMGPYFQKKLAAFADHPLVGEVRGHGLIGALEIVPTGGKGALKPDMVLGIKAAALVREEGAVVRGIRDLIAMAPPLVATTEEIDFLFESIRRGLDRLRI